MLPVSPAFLAAVRGSHGVAITATLLDPPGQTGVAPTGRALAVVDGEVTLDGTADIRGSLSLTVADAWPAGRPGATELAPYGAEVAVSRGIVFGNGRVERVPLGVYRLNGVEQADAPQGTLALTGQDRMAGLIDAKLIALRQFVGGTTLGAIVHALVTDVLPDAVISWDDATSSATIPYARIVEENDRWAFLDDLIRAHGKTWYWDYRGALVIADAPDPASVVWEASAGAGGVLVSVGRSRTREGVHNAVVASGNSQDGFAPASAVATDDDPASTTWWDGPFGKVPFLYESENIYTTDQATTAAARLLRQYRGLPYSVDFTQVPNPALVPGDAVRVIYPPVRGLHPPMASEVHVLDVVRIPLAAEGTMACATRLQTTGG